MAQRKPRAHQREQTSPPRTYRFDCARNSIYTSVVANVVKYRVDLLPLARCVKLRDLVSVSPRLRLQVMTLDLKRGTAAADEGKRQLNGGRMVVES